MSTDSFSDNRRKRHIYMDSKLDDLPLTMEAYRVYCHLCRRAGCDNNAFPSYKSIGEFCFRGSFPNSPTDTLRRKAIAVMNTWEKTKGGWTNLMQRYNQALQTEKQPLPQQRTALAHKVKNITSSSLEDALAQDRIRRQQEQSIRVPSNGYQHSPQMLELKAKLQAKANEPKVPSNSKPSSTNLREVEAQLKLALRA
ncbi:MAG: hypothetical protein RMY64_33230 [Nostoc sp. DedQUE08]|uniref:hypothetical protein n=1 Tax=Nostoc sp. DedQUE08 TaxID=3075393 RepID=UPI002AD50506|nr:hypothetical protein [Nostoc sp. DedQUE08]MDZ8070419.1 hypothetical protein [Nostoc sp. DedQUE08]